MTNSTELIVNANNSVEINLINDAIKKNLLKYYKYENFGNVQEIGSGTLGKVYRANWKNSHKCIALKSFPSLNSTTVRETIYEFKLQNEVDFHDNIQLYGITNIEIKNNQVNRYMLVMEYADGGTLRDHLKNHFNSLTLNDKLNLALQLAYAVSCMHDVGIMHCGLHSGNVLIHQNAIKLSDFGLSKRIEKESNPQSNFKLIPYIDPKKFNRNSHVYSLNTKSDVYSVGVLLWEIFSGLAPFNSNGTNGVYDIGLAVEISQGLRETIVPDTPSDYAKLYSECWNGEPDERPSIQEVVRRLRNIILQINSYQKCDKIIMKETRFSTTTTTSSEQQIMMNKKAPLSESMIVDKIVEIIFKLINGGYNEIETKKYIIDYLNNCKINSKGIYDWIINNQNKDNTNLIFLRGYFNYYEIEIKKNYDEAFLSFLVASEKNHKLAQYYVGLCYEFGNGAKKSVQMAFKYYEKLANENYAAGEYKVGFFYDKGLGLTKKDLKIAAHWYKKAADNGSLIAQFNLAIMYKDGIENNKDLDKAFEIFKQLAERDYHKGISMLGYCYYNGIGTTVDHQRGFELCKKAANLGNIVAQYNLANMYEGVIKDIEQAIYWYKSSAKQGYQKSQSKLENLMRNIR